jgi:hypothetical protein
MNDNLKHWDHFADIDPKFTKPITGKAYKGTSPNPQYVIRCLTEMFGPVGLGFGWDVVAEAWEQVGGETIHWCRIKFWHTDRANTFDSYGQTRAAYTTNNGKSLVDEDAPKKSLTDAVVKAASQVGVAANIFLGRWDDQKYVAEVNAEYRNAEKPPFNAPAAAQRIKDRLNRCKTIQELVDVWSDEKDAILAVKTAEAVLEIQIVNLKDKLKADLTNDKARQADGGDAGLEYQ